MAEIEMLRIIAGGGFKTEAESYRVIGSQLVQNFLLAEKLLPSYLDQWVVGMGRQKSAEAISPAS